MDIIERGYMLITLGVKGLMSLCVCLFVYDFKLWITD